MPTKGNTTATGGFGDRLRREREMRGITLDEITESTKIARRHLNALEKERFDQLPGGVFNKGFVKAYARFLGLDEDQAVADYAAVANEQPEPEDKFPLEVHAKPDPDLNPKRSYMPLAFAVAALVGVLVGYAFWAKSKPHNAETAQVTDSSPAAIEPASTSSTPGSQPAGAITSGRPEALKPQQSASAEATPPATPEKVFFVSVKAREDAWVSIVVDGKSVMERVMNADKHKKIKAGKSLVLRTGNAGGIDVSFNGRSLGPLGNANEPRTLTFGPTGLVSQP
jgi:cytoskeleton protein RodZ